MIDPFLKLKYGNILEIDVHGKTLEEARAEILYYLNTVDSDVQGLLIVHGIHKGVVIKNWIRHKFIDDRVIKIVNHDAGSTLLVLAENIAKL